MKKLVVILLSVFAFVACSKEEEQPQEMSWEVDFTPITMWVYVHDANGVDLLDPQSESGIDLENIFLEFEGETYTVKGHTDFDNYVYYSTTRYLASYFDGIALRHPKDSDYCLYIGYWNSDAKRHYTEMTLHWGDGTSDKLGFTSDYDYDPSLKNNPEQAFGYTFYRSGFLNGKLVDADNNPQLKFTIIR